MSLKKTFSILFFLLLFISANVFAQAIPLKNLTLHLVPTNKKNSYGLSSKTIQVSKTKKNLKVTWYSLVKELDEAAAYPTYKIKSSRGVIDTDNIELKNGYFQPALWGQGYIRTQSALPLWIDPEYLSLRNNQEKLLNTGILNASKNLLRLAPDKLYEQITYFQNLYDQYVESGQIKDGTGLRKSDKRELKKFIKEFFYVKNIAKTKANITVNQLTEKYPARIIGNNYFQFIVIDDPLNPLVLSFKLYPDKAPKLFKRVLKELQEGIEFYVSQINY
jgi:hypothetical protein